MSMHRKTAQLMANDSKNNPEGEQQKAFCETSEMLAYKIYKETLGGGFELEEILKVDMEVTRKIKEYFLELGYNVLLFKLVNYHAIYINWK